MNSEYIDDPGFPSAFAQLLSADGSCVAITFEDLIIHGLKTNPAGRGPDGFPWHFEYAGFSVTNENQDVYLISQEDSQYLVFRRGDVLILANGKLRVQPTCQSVGR